MISILLFVRFFFLMSFFFVFAFIRSFLLNKVETITSQKFIKIRYTLRKTRIFPQGTSSKYIDLIVTFFQNIRGRESSGNFVIREKTSGSSMNDLNMIKRESVVT